MAINLHFFTGYALSIFEANALSRSIRPKVRTHDLNGHT